MAVGHLPGPCLKDTGQLTGFIRLSLEEGTCERTFSTGYVFNAAYHRPGYASEACRAVLGRAFGPLQAARVAPGTAAANQASCRLLERLGLHKTSEEVVSFTTNQNGKPFKFLG